MGSTRTIKLDQKERKQLLKLNNFYKVDFFKIYTYNDNDQVQPPQLLIYAYICIILPKWEIR